MILYGFKRYINKTYLATKNTCYKIPINVVYMKCLETSSLNIKSMHTL